MVFICGCGTGSDPGYPGISSGHATDHPAEEKANDDNVSKEAHNPDKIRVHGIINTEGSITVSKDDTGNAEGPLSENGLSEDVNGDDGIRLVMVGDILLHIPIDRNCMMDDGSYDYTHIFENTKDDISSADVALVNEEVIIGGKELGVTGYPSFNAPFEIGDALADAGFDVICHATNHALDRGKTGVVNCLDYWESEHPDISVVGIYGSSKDRDNIYIYEKNRIKIAVLNYTYGTNGVKMPKGMDFAVNLLNEEVVADDLRRAEELADLTVVCPHWGTEYNLGISSEQKKWTEIFLENGADLVLGTHPHVIEPIEWVEDEETGNRMLVYYSLGNYVNWTAGHGPGTSNRMVGGLALVNIGRDDLGNVVIRDYGVEALVCHLTKEKGGITVYRLTDYDEELARSNEIVNQDPDFSKQYCIDLCDNVWGKKWL